MNDEKMKVLKMLEEGKVNADEAARLLGALDDQPAAGPAAAAAPGGKARSLHIRVFKEGNDRARVNVHVPLALAKWALRFGGKHATAQVGDKELDMDEIEKFLDQAPGEIMTVEDDDSGERVEITLK